MKKKCFCLALLLALCFSAVKAQTNSICKTIATNSIKSVSTQVCQTFTVRIYVHHVRSASLPNGLGYDSNIDNVILSNLNTVYNQYGISFVLSGSRDWIAPIYISPNLGNVENILNISNDAQNGKQSNAINIYVLPKNDPLTANDGRGKAENIPSNVMYLFGARNVIACGSNQTTNYEIASSKVVAHEMGHCLGLVHTWANNGDDGLSDTSIDNVTSNTCVNPANNCQFVANCSTCNVSSNPINQHDKCNVIYGCSLYECFFSNASRFNAL